MLLSALEPYLRYTGLIGAMAAVFRAAVEFERRRTRPAIAARWFEEDTDQGWIEGCRVSVTARRPITVDSMGLIYRYGRRTGWRRRRHAAVRRVFLKPISGGTYVAEGETLDGSDHTDSIIDFLHAHIGDERFSCSERAFVQLTNGAVFDARVRSPGRLRRRLRRWGKALRGQLWRLRQAAQRFRR